MWGEGGGDTEGEVTGDVVGEDAAHRCNLADEVLPGMVVGAAMGGGGGGGFDLFGIVG